jgi:hypothetical protein
VSEIIRGADAQVFLGIIANTRITTTYAATICSLQIPRSKQTPIALARHSEFFSFYRSFHERSTQPSRRWHSCHIPKRYPV